MQSITQIGGERSIDANQLPFTSIQEMKKTLMNDEEFMSGSSRDLHFFKASVEVLAFMSNRLMWYSACPECKKKVTPDGGSED